LLSPFVRINPPIKFSIQTRRSAFQWNILSSPDVIIQKIADLRRQAGELMREASILMESAALLEKSLAKFKSISDDNLPPGKAC
jgi:hypothetical protein